MNENSNDLEKNTIIQLQDIKQEIATLNVLIRTNNLLLSRMILSIANMQKYLNIPSRLSFYSFQLLKSEYDELCTEFGKINVDKALFRLDRFLLTNKQHCPNNIAQHIRKRLSKRQPT